MPWREVTRMSLREEYVQLAMQVGSNRRELCRRFGISAKTDYKWLSRYPGEGASGPQDRSRRLRPFSHRRRSRAGGDPAADRIAQLVGRTQARPLARGDGARPRLAPSTATGILRRAGLIDPAVAAGQRPFQRFERSAPNALWQMDFKGHFPMLSSARCHPLTVLDDHSRFSLVLRACADERAETVREALSAAFRRYGPSLHRAWPVAHPARHQSHSWPSLSSADPGQGRTLPSHA
jgi:transposase InsO family protein